WTVAVELGSRFVDVDALERSGEAVRVALAADLAVGGDVDAGLLLRADREQRGVVLRLREMRLGDAPQLLRAHARREAAGELLAVDQPFGLRVTADQRGRKKHRHSPYPSTNFGEILRSRPGSTRPLR